MKLLSRLKGFWTWFGLPLFVFGVLWGVMLLLLWTVAYPSPVTPTPHAAVLSHLSVSAQRDTIVAQEARRAGVPVPLALAVSHIENWSGDSLARSNRGAVGIMQVLPKYWREAFPNSCGAGSLYQRRRNACIGVRILAQYHDRYRSWGRALRAYHGDHDSGVPYSDAVFEQMVTAGEIGTP